MTLTFSLLTFLYTRQLVRTIITPSLKSEYDMAIHLSVIAHLHQCFVTLDFDSKLHHELCMLRRTSTPDVNFLRLWRDGQLNVDVDTNASEFVKPQVLTMRLSVAATLPPSFKNVWQPSQILAHLLTSKSHRSPCTKYKVSVTRYCLVEARHGTDRE